MLKYLLSPLWNSAKHRVTVDTALSNHPLSLSDMHCVCPTLASLHPVSKNPPPELYIILRCQSELFPFPGGEGDARGWDGWMASPTRWTWVWMAYVFPSFLSPLFHHFFLLPELFKSTEFATSFPSGFLLQSDLQTAVLLLFIKHFF